MVVVGTPNLEQVMKQLYKLISVISIAELSS